MPNLTFFLLCLAWLAAMAAMAAAGPLAQHVWVFSVLYCLAFGLLAMLVHHFPQDLNSKGALGLILTLGLAGRALFLFYPVGNDLFRYIWEGHIQNLGFNPYVWPPDSAVMEDVAQGELHLLWQNINHKELSAAYPPLTLLLFRILAALTLDPLGFKIVLVGFDVGVIIILALTLKLRGLRPSRLLFYAANPLVILFIGGEGHLDAMQVFFLCLGIYLILRAREGLGFFSLGLAVITKYLALIAVPFWVDAPNRKKSLTVLIPLFLYLPWINGGTGLFKSLAHFGTGMHYNDSITALLRWWLGPAALPVALLLLMVCLVWIYLTVHDQLRSVYMALGSLLVLLPTLHPWYLVLMAPFLVFFPSRAWLYLMGAVVCTFPVMARDFESGIFQEIHWLKFLEYGPFYGLLLGGLVREGLLLRERSFPRPRSISVILPTLNEAASIGRCLKALQNRTGVKEVIVVDGGSTDDTRKIAAGCGARVVRSRKGRGFQIKAGTLLATGDVIIILHADSILQEGALARIIQALAADPCAVGGALGMRFEEDTLKIRLIATLNNSRAFLTGVAFGDQAQFFRIQVLKLMGGYPAMMLMEDVELSLRLKDLGRVLFLSNGVSVSGRRWRGRGFSAKLATVLRLFPRYLIERRLRLTDSVQRKYYEVYYAEN
ncbi:MAG: TIGR04283 family arsenosugar biosynthesis glycosyltransferase [Desulfobacterales bacterium]|nr:MAG: TIGR04283 family arsenosugar biosynthesis glycosyltransferase [Desulfobacterales bacterium]